MGRMFLFNSFLMLVTTMWTRFFDWFYIVCKLVSTFYTDGNWTYLIVGTPILILFSLFNVFCIVIPTWTRFFKFHDKLKNFKALNTKSADETSRRLAIEDLQASASHFVSIEIN